VDLDSACPFWQDEGSCVLESCSVCAADEKELPRTWIEHATSAGHDMEQDPTGAFGWVSQQDSKHLGFDLDDPLGRLKENSVQSASADIERA
jgi:hypothetical protein